MVLCHLLKCLINTYRLVFGKKFKHKFGMEISKFSVFFSLTIQSTCKWFSLNICLEIRYINLNKNQFIDFYSLQKKKTYVMNAICDAQRSFRELIINPGWFKYAIRKDIPIHRWCILIAEVTLFFKRKKTRDWKDLFDIYPYHRHQRS